MGIRLNVLYYTPPSGHAILLDSCETYQFLGQRAPVTIIDPLQEPRRIGVPYPQLDAAYRQVEQPALFIPNKWIISASPFSALGDRTQRR